MPLIRLPFSFQQRWEKLLFLHYPVAPDVLQARLPEGLIPDTHEGVAWLSVVPFRLTYWLPGLPVPQRFNELNLRTYVKPVKTDRSRPAGVYFFCLDANDWLSVEAARAMYHLNYFHAKSHLSASTVQGQKRINFESERQDDRASSAIFKASYQPMNEPLTEDLGAHHWLTDRYRLYTTTTPLSNRLYSATIEHAPWQLQKATFQVNANTLFKAHGFDSPATTPLVAYADRLAVKANPLE